jgi:hypothetical protein
VPPLAQKHLDGAKCGGLADLFYVLAMNTKLLSDAAAKSKSQKRLAAQKAHQQLLTLASDSGLARPAEMHLTKASNFKKNVNATCAKKRAKDAEAGGACEEAEQGLRTSLKVRSIPFPPPPPSLKRTQTKPNAPFH